MRTRYPWDNRKTHAWHRLRAALIAQAGPNPPCAICGQPITGRIVLGHRTDIATANGPAGRWAVQLECRPCSDSGGGSLRAELHRARNHKPPPFATHGPYGERGLTPSGSHQPTPIRPSEAP